MFCYNYSMEKTYIPLYRKYRPQKLEELVGQEHIKNALKNAIELGKISHAYLFTGPRGTGKTSTARILAKSLNCKNGPTIDPCGVCESCIDITNTVPIDVIEIDAASNRKVEDTQNILEKILYAPVYGKYKIYIIDEVHMLSNTAFNSLLKTLEEPPENVIFILATTEVHKVLDTIKSRCQRFDFRRITVSDIVSHLRYISDNEGINISDDALYSIAKNSAGGMRDSVALLDQISVLGSDKPISVDDVNQLLGRVSFDVLHSITDSIIMSSPNDAIKLLQEIYNNGNEPVQILSNLLDYLRNLLVAKSCRKELLPELININQLHLDSLYAQSEKLETHQIIALIDKCADYLREIKQTDNQRLWLEVAFIDLANLSENTTLAELQRRISLLESPDAEIDNSVSVSNTLKVNLPDNADIIKSNEAAKSADVSVSVDSKANENVTSNKTTESLDFMPMPKAQRIDHSGDIKLSWSKLLDNISSLPTKSLLKQWANPVVISPDKVVISINSENLLKQFIDGNKRRILVEAVNNLFNQDNSNVIVRLPIPEDNLIKVDTVAVQTVDLPQKTSVVADHKEDLPDEQEVLSIKNDSEVVEPDNSMRSDSVNMVVDLFEGKILD